MIPLALVTGFLGSGKTTFLKRIIETQRQRRLVYLVNDFSPIDVDGVSLADQTEHVVALPGGSIFCRCLVTSFINELSAIIERWHQPTAPLDGVVVEASGIADPRALPQMLIETSLAKHYQLGRIVCLIDPGTLGPLLHTLPNIIAQVQAADAIVINKTDLYDEPLIAETEHTLRTLNKTALIHRTHHANADLDLFEHRIVEHAEGSCNPCVDPNYARSRLSCEDPVDLKTLLRKLQAVGEGLYRVKGTVWTGQQLVQLDGTAGRITTEPARSHGGHTNVVLIHQPTLQDDIARLIARFENHS